MMSLSNDNERDLGFDVEVFASSWKKGNLAYD
jgi:hypothetical protein